MMKNLLRSCPVCGNLHGDVLHKQQFSLPKDSPLPREYEIVSCVKCGFVFADTPANQRIYNEYYTLLSKYEDLVVSSGSGTGSLDHIRLDQTASTIKKVLPNLTASILDMGCANGAF